jgi:hypothetical protein
MEDRFADEVDYVIGVDTHRDQNTLVVVVAPVGGAVVAQTVVRASAGGYADAVRFAERHAVVARGRSRVLVTAALA